MQLLLPSELKCLIVELLSNSLAALARTHTAFQREAEKPEALYKTLQKNTPWTTT